MRKQARKNRGDELAGVCAGSTLERIAAKEVLGQLTVADIRNHPSVPYEEDAVTRIIQDDIDEQVYAEIKGKTIQEAMEVTNKAVMEALDGLPPVKVHCSLLAEEAIHAALWDYAQKNGIEIKGLVKPKTDIGEEEVEEEY